MREETHTTQPQIRHSPEFGSSLMNKGHISLLITVLVSGFLCLGISCRNVTPVEGSSRPPPVHKNWWNYYERGMQAVAQEQWSLAREDFEVCLGVRPGAKYSYPRELWQARMYGVRFFHDYFPHRELGIALLKLGDARAAVAELEESLRQEPSGRAKHYLNEACKAMQSGMPLPPPVIVLDQEAGPAVYCKSVSMRLSGRVQARGRVGHLEVGGVREFIELAEPTRVFSRDVRLSPGVNDIAVVAADLNGRTSKRIVRCIADWRAPVLILQNVSELGGFWHVQARIADETRLADAVFKQVQSPAKIERMSDTVSQFALYFGPQESPVLEVRDAAGNCRVIDLRMLVVGVVNSEDSRRVGGFPRVGALLPVPRVGGCGLLGTSLRSVLSLRPALATVRDTLKPVLRLEREDAHMCVSMPEYYLEGEAGDAGGLSSVTINGQDYVRQQDRGAKSVSFGGRLPLERGTNRFSVVAVDMAGNRNERTLTVVNVAPRHQEAVYRMSVGVPPFFPQGDAWAWKARARLQNEFSRLPARFRVLEREEGWDYILRELDLSASELADPRAALRIGKLLAAELLFVGTVLKQGAGVTVQVRVVDAADASIAFTADVYADNPEKDFAYQLGGLFVKIVQGFPFAEGRVLNIGKDKASIDIGSSQGIRVGSKFIVVRFAGDPAGFQDEEVLTCAERVVTLEVDRLSQDMSRARIIPPEAGSLIQKGDHVYAR